MPAYRNIPLRAITESATKEAEEIGLDLEDIANLLGNSYDCAIKANGGKESKKDA